MKTQRLEMSLKNRDLALNNDDLILVFQDEVHFQIQTTITSAWHKKSASRK